MRSVKNAEVFAIPLKIELDRNHRDLIQFFAIERDRARKRQPNPVSGYNPPLGHLLYALNRSADAGTAALVQPGPGRTIAGLGMTSRHSTNSGARSNTAPTIGLYSSPTRGFI